MNIHEYQAKALLREAGYPNGFELTLVQSIGRLLQAEEMAQVIAGYFDKIGVKTKLEMLEWGEYNKRAGGGLHKDAFFYGFINGIWDPSYVTQRFLTTFPAFRYYDAEGDLRKALLDYEQTFDPAKRKEMAAAIPRTLHDEAVWVFLWQLDEVFGLTKKVKGFKMRADHLIWVRDATVEG